MTMETPRSDAGIGGVPRDPLNLPREPIGGTRDPLVDRAANSAHQAVDRVATKVNPTVERVRAAAQDSADTMQAKLGDLDTLRQEWTDSARAYVRERPMTAIGVAVLAGFLLSRWIRTS
jgi:ElaB/YqjD/DUF883 family membrane-anchored ribosome-binding protein